MGLYRVQCILLCALLGSATYCPKSAAREKRES